MRGTEYEVHNNATKYRGGMHWQCAEGFNPHIRDVLQKGASKQQGHANVMVGLHHLGFLSWASLVQIAVVGSGATAC